MTNAGRFVFEHAYLFTTHVAIFFLCANANLLLPIFVYYITIQFYSNILTCSGPVKEKVGYINTL